MRLAILEEGHTFASKALFALIRTFSREPVLDVIKLAKFRPHFYGKLAQKLTHEAMRGPSEWSIGDRELMAVFVARANGCEWCARAHTAVAKRAYRDGAKACVTLPDLESGALEEPLRATLRLLHKLTLDHSVDADDVRRVLDAGASRDQIEDALAVCFAFNVTTRLADAFGFSLASPKAFDTGARYLLARGYR